MYLRLSPYREVLQGVLTSLQVNEGIIKITGKNGAGKTALCSQLFHELQAAGQPAVFFLKPPASPVALQNDILDNLALDPSGNFTRTLTNYLLAKTTGQKPLVLIFDDAQQLDAQTFGAIRMLCNIQDNARALVRVVLCGTNALDDKLAVPALRAVTQFLSQSFTLPYLTQEQVNDFCHAYWMLAGEEMKPMDERVLQRLFQETRGHPGILQARLNQGTTGAERKDRPGGNDSDAAATVSRPYRYAGPRKDWVPALLIVAGLLVLGGAGAYLFLIPSFVEETVYPPLPAAVAERAQEPEPVVAAASVSAEPAAEIAGTALAEPDAGLADAGGAEAPDTAAAARAVEPAVLVPDAVPAADAGTADGVTNTVATEAPSPLPEPAAGDVAASAPAAEQGIDAEPIAEQQNRETQVAAETGLPSVEEFLTAWTASWQDKDLDTYLAYYDASFVPPQNLSREDWQQQRRRVIGNAVDIMVSAEAPESIVDAPGGLRFVRFWLDYSAANYADRTLKELLLVPDAGTWRIRAESNLRTERP